MSLIPYGLEEFIITAMKLNFDSLEQANPEIAPISFSSATLNLRLFQPKDCHSLIETNVNIFSPKKNIFIIFLCVSTMKMFKVRAILLFSFCIQNVGKIQGRCFNSIYCAVLVWGLWAHIILKTILHVLVLCTCETPVLP